MGEFESSALDLVRLLNVTRQLDEVFTINYGNDWDAGDIQREEFYRLQLEGTHEAAMTVGFIGLGVSLNPGAWGLDDPRSDGQKILSSEILGGVGGAALSATELLLEL